MANPKIQLRHDTAANWASVNPTLAEGEVGLITDTKKYVVGDGSTAFNSLPQYDMGSKFSTIPTRLELNISGNYLVASSGYVLGKNNTNLNSTSTITTADISTISNAITNNVIVGSTAGYEVIPVNSSTGRYLYYQGNNSSNMQNQMTENSNGIWFFQDSEHGRIPAGSTGRNWCLGFMFNETQPAGNYKFTYQQIQSCFFCLGYGTIGNITELHKEYMSWGGGSKTIDVTMTNPWNTIYIYLVNDDSFYPSYNCVPYIYKSATKFDTYLVSSNGLLDVKMTTDISNLSSYTDYAQIGIVKYDSMNENPVAYPDEDLANAYVSGNIADSTLSNVLSIDNNSAVKTALDNKADINLSNLTQTGLEKFVQRTGDTMTGKLNFTTDSISDMRQVTTFENVTTGTTPSTDIFTGFQTLDRQGNQFANVNCSYKTDGVISSNFWVTRPELGSEYDKKLGIYITPTGSSYAQTDTNFYVSKEHPIFHAKDTSLIKGTPPSSKYYAKALNIIDNNNISFGGIEHGYLPNGENQITMIAYCGTDAATSTNNRITVGFNDRNEAYTYAPACNFNNSIVTTVSHTYSSTNNTINAVKFGNGLIINWGRVSLNGVISSSNKVITFAIPYTTNAKVVASRNANAGQNTPVVVGWEGTTSFTIGCPSGVSSTGYVNFIAIGY